MLMISILSCEIVAMPTCEVARISANSSSRCAAVRTFESATPDGTFFKSSTTAAATTGPASGPRPTSSSPAMQRWPFLRKAFSRVSRSTGRVMRIATVTHPTRAPTGGFVTTSRRPIPTVILGGVPGLLHGRSGAGIGEPGNCPKRSALSPPPCGEGQGGGGGARFIDERGAHTPTSNSSPQGGGEQRAPYSPTEKVRAVPSPLRGGPGWGCRRLSDKRGACTPTSSSSPQGGGEQRAPYSPTEKVRAVPSPLRGGPGWGWRRLSDKRGACTPHLQLLPARGRRAARAVLSHRKGTRRPLPLAGRARVGGGVHR